MSKQQSNNHLQLTLASILAVGAAGMTQSAHAVPEQPEAWEVCAGIAKKGMNDCGALDGSHDCAGKATTSGDPDEWVYVPKGTCAKIVGGKVAAVKPARGASDKGDTGN